MKKNISIIIPVYNAEKTIVKCLDSILDNAYVDYEIILINDGSSDNSWQILESYQEKYPTKIRVFDQENQGVAKTRNRGMLLAKSEYIMFVDNDDWINNDYLEKFFQEIKKGQCDVVIGGYRRVTEQKTLYSMKLKNTPWTKYMIMAPWAKIYKREFLLKNKIEFLDNNIGEDVYFNLQVIHLTDKVAIFDYCGYNWFYNEQSVSNVSQKKVENKLNVMNLLNASYCKLKDLGIANSQEVEFYFTRYVVWYLLFAGRKSSYKNLKEEYSKIFAWLNEKFPQFYRNKNISLFRPQGETFQNKFAVFVFIELYRLKLLKIFLKVYSN